MVGGNIISHTILDSKENLELIEFKVKDGKDIGYVKAIIPKKSKPHIDFSSVIWW